MTDVTVEIDGEPIRISSPDRVVFPDRGWTKLDVVDHFLACAPAALRAVEGRPTMLKRYMKGVDRPPVYQKRVTEDSPFETVLVRFPSQRPGRMVVPRRPADIIRLVQLGCLDLHPWSSRVPDLDHPDEWRIDFDPTPGFDFGHVRAAVAGARGLLDELGLTGFPKTSGSRGIHVYVPIEPIWDHFQVRRAGLAFARELERRMGDLVTTRWWKEERRGVFIDYNQMGPDKAMSAAYGVRPTGFVSAPFTWDELETMGIEDFPMVGFADRYAAGGDPWAGMERWRGGIERLLEWSVIDQEERGLGDAPWPPHYPKQPDEPPRVQPSKRRRSDDDYRSR